MKPYSLDWRERIVRAVEEGHSRAEIMKVFEVSKNMIIRYLKQWRATGNLAPRAISGRPPNQREAVVACILPQWEAHADATLEEHCRLLQAEQGIEVSPSTMGRAFRCLGWTRKKDAVCGRTGRAQHELPGASGPESWTANNSSSSMNVVRTSP